MNKLERVDLVLTHAAVDRPPVSLWYHFGIQHGSGKQFAKITLEYFDYYDFDFLKVMNDYFYPQPQGLNSVHTAEDLRRFQRIDVTASIWHRQFEALRIISAALKDKAYFIDTVFDPWQSIKRNMAGENMKALMANSPDALLDALDIVTDNLIDYCRKSLEIGSAGIFVSVPAAVELLTRDEFLTFVKPFAVKLLSAIAGQGKMNTAHIHGEQLFFDDVLDFPVAIFNWWDRGPSGPALGEVLAQTPACVMGGIDQTLVARRTQSFLTQHVLEGIRSGGDHRFFLANGCTIDSWVYPGALQTIVDVAKGYAQR